MSLFVSSFYNQRNKRSETVLSPGSLSREQVKEYIDYYLSAEYRMVNGMDSLNIAEVDADLTVNSLSGVNAVGHQVKRKE